MAIYEMEPYEFSIVDTFKDENQDYHIRLNPRYIPDCCPECWSENLIRFGSKVKSVKDLPMFGGRVELVLDNPRFKCKDCGNTFFQQYKSIEDGKRITNRLRGYIKTNSLKKPFTQLEEELGVSDTTVIQLFREHVQELDHNRDLKAPKVLGIDENHLRKQYRAVFTDVENGRIIEILPNRSKASVKTFIKSLPGWDDIQCFTMDMWTPYRDAVYELNPKAIVIVDKFHVITKLNGALETMRKKLRSEQDKKERKHFRYSRFNLLKNMEDLDYEHQKQLLALFEAYPEFETPYFLKEEFRDVYRCETKPEVIAKYQEWKLAVKGYPEFEAIVEMVDHWQTEIFNYFLFRYTNAVTESLNKLINNIDNSGHGYTFEVLSAKALYGTPATKPAKFKGISKWPGYSAGVYGFVTTIQSEAVLTEGWGVDIRELQAVLDAGNF